MPADPSKNQRRSIELTTGRTIALHQMVVFSSSDQPDAEHSMSLLYGTDVPLDRKQDRRADATSVVRIYEQFATQRGITRITAQICNTEAAAAMREAPEQMFVFSRAADGAWVDVDPSRASESA